jgi:hypothetical protein
MTKLKIGDVVELPVGLKVYHNQGQEVLTIEVPVNVVVESVRISVVGSEDDHFEETYMCDARALQPDGTYHKEGALLTLCQYGDFRPEFILPDKPNIVLRKMQLTFVALP